MSALPPPPARKGRGCLFYLGLALVALLLVGGLLLYLTARFVRGQINAYTDAEPMTLPKVEMPAGEYERLEQRVDGFGKTLKQGGRATPLILTEREINALLARAPEVKGWENRIHVSLEKDLVKGQISLPLGEFSRLGRGRYLNGEGAFNVSLENGVLVVTAQEIQVKGKPLPESFMQQLRHENLAKDAYRDARWAEWLRKIERLEVAEDRMIVTPREGN